MHTGHHRDGWRQVLYCVIKPEGLGQTRGGEPHVEVGAGEGRSGPREDEHRGLKGGELSGNH